MSRIDRVRHISNRDLGEDRSCRQGVRGCLAGQSTRSEPGARGPGPARTLRNRKWRSPLDSNRVRQRGKSFSRIGLIAAAAGAVLVGGFVFQYFVTPRPNQDNLDNEIKLPGSEENAAFPGPIKAGKAGTTVALVETEKKKEPETKIDAKPVRLPVKPDPIDFAAERKAAEWLLESQKKHGKEKVVQGPLQLPSHPWQEVSFWLQLSRQKPSPLDAPLLEWPPPLLDVLGPRLRLLLLLVFAGPVLLSMFALPARHVLLGQRQLLCDQLPGHRLPERRSYHGAGRGRFSLGVCTRSHLRYADPGTR